MLMGAVEKQGWKAVHEPILSTVQKDPELPLSSVGPNPALEKG
jgi:hypothetical protein